METSRIASGLGYLLASQVSSRLVTFGLNLLTARHLSPEAYGLSSIQFHLLVTVVMMLSREGFRRGCLRLQPTDKSADVDTWSVLRVSWLVLPVGLVVTAAVCAATLYMSADVAAEGYALAVILHGVAIVVELLSEPFYILASVNMQYKQRLLLDSAPLAAKSLLTLATLAGWCGRRLKATPPALVFAYAQLAFAATSTLGYIVLVGLPALTQAGRHDHAVNAGKAASKAGTMTEGQPAQDAAARAAGHTSKDVSKGRRRGGSWFASCSWWWSFSPQELSVLSSTAAFSMQAVVKLVLAEGSKMVLAQQSSNYDQGVVGLVTNLGSLVVRTLFQPLEEVAFTIFSKQRAANSQSQAQTADVSSGGAANNAAAPASKEMLQQQVHLLSIMVKVVSMLGLLATAFGPPTTHVAIRVVYGVKWASTDAPAVLSVYCLYILLLAVNGVTEAFVHAVLDTKDLMNSNVLLLAPTAVHIAACTALIAKYGSTGFVLADAINMAIRIAISLLYIRSHFRGVQDFSVTHLLPKFSTLFALSVASIVLHASKNRLLPAAMLVQPGLLIKQIGMHVFVTAVVLVFTLAFIFMKTERESIRAAADMYRQGRRQGADKSKEE